jgi:hypothetical protein
VKPVIQLIARAGASLHPLATLALIVVLNVQWTVTLQAFGQQFEKTTGLEVLDLQNVQGVLSASAAQELISQYSEIAVSLYWTFFAMDNVVPLLSFGSFALLWAHYFSRSRWKLNARLRTSWFLLIPFGVGFFDIIENCFFVLALASTDSATQLSLLSWGLIFVQATAVMLFSTFITTFALTGLFGVERVLARIRRTPATASD